MGDKLYLKFEAEMCQLIDRIDLALKKNVIFIASQWAFVIVCYTERANTLGLLKHSNQDLRW